MDLISGVSASKNPVIIHYVIIHYVCSAFHVFLIFKRMFPLVDIATDAINALQCLLSTTLTLCSSPRSSTVSNI